MKYVLFVLMSLCSSVSFAGSNLNQINALEIPTRPNAQAIVADQSGTLSSVKMIMQRNACNSDPCAGSISVQLYSNSGNHPGTPLGSPITRALAAIHDFYELDPYSSNPPIEEFDLGVSVSQGVKYYLVITPDSVYYSDQDGLDIALDQYVYDTNPPSDEPFQFFNSVWQSTAGGITEGLLLTDVTIQ